MVSRLRNTRGLTQARRASWDKALKAEQTEATARLQEEHAEAAEALKALQGDQEEALSVSSESEAQRDAMAVQMTVAGVVGTGHGVFSFDAPVASFVSSINTPLSGRGSVTVSGLNFGLAEYTASAAVGSEPCSTSSWMSATSISCRGPAVRSAGGELTGTVEVTVSG